MKQQSIQGYTTTGATNADALSIDSSIESVHPPNESTPIATKRANETTPIASKRAHSSTIVTQSRSKRRKNKKDEYTRESLCILNNPNFSSPETMEIRALMQQDGHARTKQVKCPRTGMPVGVDAARSTMKEMRRVQSEQTSALKACYSTSQSIRDGANLRKRNGYTPNETPFTSTASDTMVTTPSRSVPSPKKAHNNSLNPHYFTSEDIEEDRKPAANPVPDLPEDYLHELSGEAMNVVLEGLCVKDRLTGQITYDTGYIPFASHLFGILSGSSRDEPGCQLIAAVGNRCKRGSSTTAETIELMLKMLKHRQK